MANFENEDTVGFSGACSFLKKKNNKINFFKVKGSKNYINFFKKGKKNRIMRFTVGYGPFNYSNLFIIYFFRKLHNPLNLAVSLFSKLVKKWIFSNSQRKISFFKKCVTKIWCHHFLFAILKKYIFYAKKYQNLIFWPILKTRISLDWADREVSEKKKIFWTVKVTVTCHKSHNYDFFLFLTHFGDFWIP